MRPSDLGPDEGVLLIVSVRRPGSEPSEPTGSTAPRMLHPGADNATGPGKRDHPPA